MAKKGTTEDEGIGTAEAREGWQAFGKQGLELGKDDEGEDVIRVPLLSPLEHGDEEITELLIKEPTLKQLKKAHTNETGAAELEKIISVVVGLPPVIVGSLKARDVFRVREALAYFLPGMLA